MQEMDIKRGHFGSIDGKMAEIMKDIFGNVSEKEGWYISTYGAMDPIKVRPEGKGKLMVDINTRTDVAEDVIMDTLRAKNRFLEKVTGFNASERSKRLQAKAKKGL